MKAEHNIKSREDGCPFGHKCDDCNLYVPLYKTNENGEVEQEWNCTFNNIAVLLSESKDRSVGVQAAIESFRNETVKRQDMFLGLAHTATQKRLRENGD